MRQRGSKIVNTEIAISTRIFYGQQNSYNNMLHKLLGKTATKRYEKFGVKKKKEKKHN